MLDDSDYQTLHRKWRAACKDGQAQLDRALAAEAALTAATERAGRLQTSVEELLANDRAVALLDRYAPGLLTNLRAALGGDS